MLHQEKLISILNDDLTIDEKIKIIKHILEFWMDEDEMIEQIAHQYLFDVRKGIRDHYQEYDYDYKEDFAKRIKEIQFYADPMPIKTKKSVKLATNYIQFIIHFGRHNPQFIQSGIQLAEVLLNGKFTLEEEHFNLLIQFACLPIAETNDLFWDLLITGRFSFKRERFGQGSLSVNESYISEKIKTMDADQLSVLLGRVKEILHHEIQNFVIKCIAYHNALDLEQHDQILALLVENIPLREWTNQLFGLFLEKEYLPIKEILIPSYSDYSLLVNIENFYLVLIKYKVFEWAENCARNLSRFVTSSIEYILNYYQAGEMEPGNQIHYGKIKETLATSLINHLDNYFSWKSDYFNKQYEMCECIYKVMGDKCIPILSNKLINSSHKVNMGIAAFLNKLNPQNPQIEETILTGYFQYDSIPNNLVDLSQFITLENNIITRMAFNKSIHLCQLWATEENEAYFDYILSILDRAKQAHQAIYFAYLNSCERRIPLVDIFENMKYEENYEAYLYAISKYELNEAKKELKKNSSEIRSSINNRIEYLTEIQQNVLVDYFGSYLLKDINFFKDFFLNTTYNAKTFLEIILTSTVEQKEEFVITILEHFETLRNKRSDPSIISVLCENPLGAKFDNLFYAAYLEDKLPIYNFLRYYAKCPCALDNFYDILLQIEENNRFYNLEVKKYLCQAFMKTKKGKTTGRMLAYSFIR